MWNDTGDAIKSLAYYIIKKILRHCTISGNERVDQLAKEGAKETSQSVEGSGASSGQPWSQKQSRMTTTSSLEKASCSDKAPHRSRSKKCSHEPKVQTGANTNLVPWPGRPDSGKDPTALPSPACRVAARQSRVSVWFTVHGTGHRTFDKDWGNEVEWTTKAEIRQVSWQKVKLHPDLLQTVKRKSSIAVAVGFQQNRP